MSVFMPAVAVLAHLGLLSPSQHCVGPGQAGGDAGAAGADSSETAVSLQAVGPLAFPPDSLPIRYYQRSSVMEEPACSGIAFPRHIVLLSFSEATTLAERQAAVDLVDGTVVGGIPVSEQGIYIIRVEDDARGVGVCEAARTLEGLPSVEVAGPDHRTEIQEAATWTLSSEATEMGRGADELFQEIMFGWLLPDGGVVVADAGALFLRVYGREGERQVEVGRSGEGPGEFRTVHGLWLTPEGTIGVWDSENRRFTTFDPRGELVATRPVGAAGDAASGRFDAFLGSFDNGDVLLASLRLEGRPVRPTPERWVLGRFGPDGEFRSTLGEVSGMWRAGRAPLPFTPVPRVAVGRDSIWLAHGYEAELEVWSASGDVVRTVELPWSVDPAGDPWATLEAELRRRDKHWFLDLLDQAPRIGEFPAVGGLLTDDRGHLWVKVYDPSSDSLWLLRNALEVAPGGEWRILGPEGEWVARIQMPDHLRPLDIRGNRLLGVARDAFGVERVVVHTVAK